MKKYSYINTLVSDTEEDYELKSLFENIDKTIEMLDEEAPVMAAPASVPGTPVPSSPMQNVKQAPQRYPNENKENALSNPQVQNNPNINSKLTQVYLNPSTLGPKYILVEVERFRNLSPEDCEKLTGNPNIAKQNLPASTQHMNNKQMQDPNKSFGMVKSFTGILMSSLLFQVSARIISGVIFPAFIIGKNAVVGIAKRATGSNGKWVLAAGACLALLTILIKILKKFNKVNKKENTGVQTNITVSKISNESVYLTIIDEYDDHNIEDIPFKKYIEIMTESASNPDKIGEFFNNGFDTIETSCRTLEETPNSQSKFKAIVEKITGVTNYCLIKAKAAFASKSPN